MNGNRFEFRKNRDGSDVIDLDWLRAHGMEAATTLAAADDIYDLFLSIGTPVEEVVTGAGRVIPSHKTVTGWELNMAAGFVFFHGEASVGGGTSVWAVSKQWVHRDPSGSTQSPHPSTGITFQSTDGSSKEKPEGTEWKHPVKKNKTKHPKWSARRKARSEAADGGW